MLNNDAELDQIYRALSDPTRRAMVERLTQGAATVSELAQPFDMSLPGLTQHQRVLEDSGLVRTHKVGRVRSCSLDFEALGRAERWINQRRQAWTGRFDRLGALLVDDDQPDSDRQSQGDQR
jgi:DNA-binding transcriptional ArsR family regulator